MSILVWIIYDISDDRVRGRIAKACKKSGMERVQKSAFLGRMEMNRFDELAAQCEELIDEKTDSLYLFPFCQDDFRKIKVLGHVFEGDLSEITVV